jgi:thioredoxin-like negative regulator of GroEL
VPARAFNQWRGLATQTQPPPTASSFAQKKTNSPPQQKSSSAADSNIYEVNEANFLKEAIEASDKRVVLIDCYAEYFPIFSIIATRLRD